MIQRRALGSPHHPPGIGVGIGALEKRTLPDRDLGLLKQCPRAVLALRYLGPTKCCSTRYTGARGEPAGTGDLGELRSALPSELTSCVLPHAPMPSGSVLTQPPQKVSWRANCQGRLWEGPNPETPVEDREGAHDRVEGLWVGGAW